MDNEKRDKRLMALINFINHEDEKLLHKTLLELLMNGYCEGDFDLNSQTYIGESFGMLIDYMTTQQKIFLLLERYMKEVENDKANKKRNSAMKERRSKIHIVK